MRCKSSFIYLAIKKLIVDKTAKKRAKGKVLAVRASKNLFRLFRLEDLNLEEAKKAAGELALMERNLVAIIQF